MIAGWAWTLLNLYLVISLCAILFDLFVMLTADARQRAQERRSATLQTLLEGQLTRVREGREPTSGCRWICSGGSGTSTVSCLCDLADGYSAAADPAFARYLAQSGPSSQGCAAATAEARRCTGPPSRGCWPPAGRISPRRAPSSSPAPPTGAHLLPGDRPYRPSTGGSQDAVIRALKRMSQEDIHHSQKLLTDGLLSFRGDRMALCGRLWAEFSALSPALRLVTVDPMRFLTPTTGRSSLPAGRRRHGRRALLRRSALLRRCTYPPARAH